MESDVFKTYGLALLMRFEGLYLRPYLCPAGIPTIGLGSTRYPNGQAVTLQDAPITKEQAIAMAETQYNRDYLPAVLKLCPCAKGAQLAALVDFAYNLGINALKSSTLRKKFNAGDIESARRELKKWVYANGKKLKGLEIRREAEAALL